MFSKEIVKKYLFILFLLTLTYLQGEELDSTYFKWTPSLITSVNLSQIAFTNWEKGGKDSYSYVFSIDWGMKYKGNGWSFKNKFKGILGHSKLGDDEVNITSNSLLNETVFLGSGILFKPYASNLIRSPITNGFDYKKDPAEHIVSFFDPGYISQSLGFSYENSKIIKSRLGFAFEESFANKFAEKYTDDPTTLTDVEKFKFETGIESITDIKYEVAENIHYKGKLRLFSGFDRLEVWDVAMDNSVTAKVNTWLNVNFTYVIVHKTSESLRTQIKEGIQVGVVYSFF
jgi:hypothetical protein